MRAYVVHSDSSDPRASLLTKLLKQYGHETVLVLTLGDVREHPRYTADRCLVILPDTSNDVALADDAIRFAEAEGRQSFVIYIADTMAAESYKRLVRSGAGEWITWEALTRELVEVLRNAESTQSPLSGESAMIISFLPSKGGVGNTTLSLEAGIYLASDKQNRPRVAVLDLNFQSSTLADYVDLEPRFDIAEIMDRPERLDGQLVDIFASKHPSNVDIFSSPPRLVPSQNIKPEVIFALLDEIGKRYSFVLLDLPNQWQPWLDNVLQGSSAIIVTGEPTVPSIRQAVNKQKHLDSLSIERDRAAIVMNCCETGILGRIPRKSELEQTFAERKIFYVRRDVATAAEAANTGQPMMMAAPNQAVSKDIRRVGDWIHLVRAKSDKPHESGTGH